MSNPMKDLRPDLTKPEKPDKIEGVNKPEFTMSFLSKAKLKVKNTLRGNNAVGRVIFATLDVLPVPNVHEIIKAIIKRENDVGFRDGMKLFFKELDILRTLVAIIVAALMISGVVPEELARELLEAIGGAE